MLIFFNPYFRFRKYCNHKHNRNATKTFSDIHYESFHYEAEAQKILFSYLIMIIKDVFVHY